MTKHKVRADVRALADKYYCEQCDRLGVPRPHPIKPLKTPKPGKTDVDKLVETGVWINPKKPRHAFVKRTDLPSSDPRGYVVIDEASMARDTADGLSLEALWRSGHEMFSRDDEWAAYREKD